LYSVVAVVRYVADAYQILHYQNVLTEMKYDPWPVPDAFGFLIGLGTLTLIVVGSIGTLGFIRSSMKGSRVNNP